uniref:Uncharacterized protein ycf68 n=1 Tax=Zea mays TaxID=4577 RepID=A0A804UNT1_MAIZE
MAYSSCLNRSLKPNKLLLRRIDGADSGEIPCRSNFLFTRGIRAVRGGPPRLLSSRESIHPLSVYGELSLEHRLRFVLNGKMEPPNNASSQTKNYEITPFHSGVTEGSYHSSLFFHAFPGGLEKAVINRLP